MAFLRRLFTARVGPELCGAAIIQPVMTIVGVFTFLAGALYLPSLAPMRVEMIVVLLLLATVALLSTAVGQLTAILERLDRRDGNSPDSNRSRPPVGRYRQRRRLGVPRQRRNGTDFAAH